MAGIVYDFETLTVSNAALPFTASKVNPDSAHNFDNADAVFLTVGGDDLRIRFDGGTPTDTVGHLVPAGSGLLIAGRANIANARMVRETTDVTVSVTYMRGSDLSSGIFFFGGASGGAGGGSSATEYTEGGTDSSITGVAALWEAADDTLSTISAATPLPVTVISGGTAGTEYVEDVASAADPSGGMLIAVRKDTLAAITNTDGDNIALRATNKGEVYVKQTDAVPVTDNGGALTVDNAGVFAVQDSAAEASLSVIDDWDESDRAKVNPIVGQAGIAAGAGAVGVTVPRTTLASDDPAVTALQIIDDWDETDRAKVNLIVGQAGIAAGAGAVGVTVPRVTHASDDPVTTALQIMDDWDETDRAKVNIIAGQAGVAAGAGAVGATVIRVTHASDDPAVTALQLIDNIVSGSEAQVDVVAALPAGDNNIGNVDVLSVPADPFGANADAAATAGGEASISAKLRLMTTQLEQIRALIEVPVAANVVSGITTTITDTTATGVLTASAGTNLYVTAVHVQNSDATVGTWVNLIEETSGTILDSFYAAPNGGGATHNYPVPLKVPTADKDLQVQCVTTSAEVRVGAVGYKA